MKTYSTRGKETILKMFHEAKTTEEKDQVFNDFFNDDMKVQFMVDLLGSELQKRKFEEQKEIKQKIRDSVSEWRIDEELKEIEEEIQEDINNGILDEFELEEGYGIAEEQEIVIKVKIRI